jgi:hypothetical protein
LHDFCILKTETFTVHKIKKDRLYLNLAGDVDENSAHELFNTLIEHGADYNQIFIPCSWCAGKTGGK